MDGTSVGAEFRDGSPSERIAGASGWSVPGVTPGRSRDDGEDAAGASIGLIAAERVRQAVAAVMASARDSAGRDCPHESGAESTNADPAGESGSAVEGDAACRDEASATGAFVSEGSGAAASVASGLASCLGGAEEAIAGLDRVWALDQSMARDCVITAEFVLSRIQAIRNRLVRVVQVQGESSAAGKRLVRGILEDVCHVSASRSGRVVDSAVLTDPDTGILRELGAALAAGEVTGEHVEVARCGVARMSRSILRERREQIDALITEHARNHPPEATAQLLAFLEHRLGVGRLERAPDESRRLALVHGAGTSFLSGQVDEATGRKLDALLDALIARTSITGHIASPLDLDGEGTSDQRSGHSRAAFSSGAAGAGDSEGLQEQIEILDARTRAQQRADAFSELVDLAGDHLALVRDSASGEPVTTGVGGHLNRKPLHSVARLVLHCHPDTGQAPRGRPDSARAERSARGDPEAEPAERGAPRNAATPRPDDAARDAGPGGTADADRQTGCAGEGCDGSARWAGFAASTDDQSPLHPVLTDLHACDAVFDLARFDGRGRLISFTSVGRLAGDRLTAAVIARDQCCSFPGCTRPPAMCHVHHVIWHRHGGPTSLDNLALLCGRHHRLIHAQPKDPRDGWEMGMRDGIPHARPPARLTPARFPEPPWIRNTHPADLTRARDLARQLELDLDDTS